MPPALVNSDPEGEGWFLKMKPDHSEKLAGLMNEHNYQKYIADN